MKKLILSISLLTFIQLTAGAQAPAGFNYQGIARNTAGAPLAAKTLGIRISIHDISAAGNVAYQETQTVTTNAYGLYNLSIGNGSASIGTLAAVNWGAGNKFIQVELDPNGGSAYADMGTSQLMSVPFALQAASAPAPTLSLSNDSLTAGGNKIKLPSVPVYTGGTGVTVSATGVISVNNLAGDVSGVPGANTVAKIQGIGVSATTPSSGQVLKFNGTAYAPALDNDVQTLSISGTSLTISNGNAVTLPGFTGTGTSNYMPKFTGTGTVGASSIYDLNSRIGINTTSPQLDLDIVADSFGIRSASAPWDNIWFHHDGTYASMNANGADYGLLLRVGANGGTITGPTVNNTASTLDTVMALLPNGNVGVGTITPTSTMDIRGSMSLPIYTATANYMATANDYTILCRASLSPYIITLPSASGIAGRIYVIRRAPLLATNILSVITVTSVSGINGANGAATSISMTGNNAVTVQSDGSSWYVISGL